MNPGTHSRPGRWGFELSGVFLSPTPRIFRSLSPLPSLPKVRAGEMPRYADVPRREVGLLWTERWRRGWQKQNNSNSNKQAPGCIPTRWMSPVTQILCCPRGCRPRVGSTVAQPTSVAVRSPRSLVVQLSPLRAGKKAPFSSTLLSPLHIVLLIHSILRTPACFPSLASCPPAISRKGRPLWCLCGGEGGGDRFWESERKLSADPEQPSRLLLPLQAPGSRFAGGPALTVVF